MKKSTTRVTVAVIIMIVLVVGYYCYLVNRSRNAQPGKEDKNPVQEVMSRNMEHAYPPTPKEVILYYNEIQKCFYNEECTEEELKKLVVRSRELYDEELTAKNELETQLIILKSEIADYKEKGRRISSISVSSSTDVEYFDQDGYSFAKLRSTYNIMDNKTLVPTTEVFLLRKDSDGHWKIYGWAMSDQTNTQEE